MKTKRRPARKVKLAQKRPQTPKPVDMPAATAVMTMTAFLTASSLMLVDAKKVAEKGSTVVYLLTFTRGQPGLSMRVQIALSVTVDPANQGAVIAMLRSMAVGRTTVAAKFAEVFGENCCKLFQMAT